MALFRIIQKNLKLLIRSKSSALIIILGPLLVIFLVGIAFDNIEQFSLNIGTYSSDYSELSESFIGKLQAQELSVQKIESEEACISQIKQSRLHTCIIFPPGLSVDSNNVNEIVFHVDYSKMNLIWTVLDTISNGLDERSSELSLGLTQNLLTKIDTTKSEVIAKQPTIDALKSENQLSSEKIGLFGSNVNEFKSASAEMKEYILLKVNDARGEIDDIKSDIDGSNASDSQKNSLKASVSSIDTYLYNIYSRIEDPNNLSESDWGRITRLTNEVDSQLLGVSQTISDSGPKLDELEASLSGIASNLESIEIREAATIVNPIITNIKPVIPEKTYLNYMFPSLIVLVVMFISILLSTTLVMMDKHSPAYFRNFITPTRSITFILATYFTNLFLVAIQLAVILGISTYFFKAQIVQSLQILLPGLLLITTLFTFIGMLIGNLFHSEETSTLASISIGSIFLFLSNVILPLESMPAYVRNVAKFNPFVLAEEFLRRSIFFNASFKELAFEIKYLAIYTGVIFVLIWIFRKASRKHFLHKLLHHKPKIGSKPIILKK